MQSITRIEAANLIQQARAKILHDWEARARDNVDAARAQSSVALRDSLPEFIDQLIKTLLATDPKKLDDANARTARKHGEDRAQQEEYTLDEVIYEYHLLRAVLMTVLELNHPVDFGTRFIVHHYVDRGIRKAAVEYAERATIRGAAEKVEKERSAERLAQAIEVAKVGFFDWDIENDKVTFSEQMQKDWGIAGGTTLQTVVYSIHPDDREYANKTIRDAIEKHTPFSAEYRVIRPDEKIIWIEAQGKVSYTEEGVAQRFFGTSLDISERKAFERRLAVEHKKLALSVQALKAERELRERFVATLTHDLRTPLTAARLSAQLLLRKPDDAASSKNMAARIIASVDRSEAMVRDLLDANRLKAGEGIPIFVTECDLNEIVKRLSSDSFTLSGREFKIHNESGEIKGAWDSAALQRVLENLTSNAIKYGAPSAPITIGLIKGDNFVELSVHNEGEPISAEDQKSLFESYRRSDSAIKSGQKGWGIGLALVKAIADAHGGSVRVESDKKNGTTFFVKLPLHTTPKPWVESE